MKAKPTPRLHPYAAFGRQRLYYGDSRLLAPRVAPVGGFHACVTDPPYGLDFMGKEWDRGNGCVAFDPRTWRTFGSSLRPGGYLLAFGGTRKAHRLAAAIEDAGFEVRDTVYWVHGQGFPKSLDVSKAIDAAAGAVRRSTGPRVYADGHVQKHGGGKQGFHDWNGVGVQNGSALTTKAAKQWQGWGTALKPAIEPIILAQKPLDGTYAENLLKHGCGALNIDACRVVSAGGRHREGEPSQDRRYRDKGGTSFTGRPGPRGGSPSGRFPANLIHDGSPEATAGFPQTPGGVIPGRRTGMGFKGGAAGQDELVAGKTDAGSAARYFYAAKPSRYERGKTNMHATVKPIALMRYLLRLVVPPGGYAFDPFAGSGTTLIAAEAEGFACVGVEKGEDEITFAADRFTRYETELADDELTV